MRGDGEMHWWCLRDDEVELVGRGEVADAGVGDGSGLVRRHHVVPCPHRPSPAAEAAAADASRGRAGEERGARRARPKRAVWRRGDGSWGARLVRLGFGRDFSGTARGPTSTARIFFFFADRPVLTRHEARLASAESKST